jgi:hypothetical protein
MWTVGRLSKTWAVQVDERAMEIRNVLRRASIVGELVGRAAVGVFDVLLD